MNISHQYDDFFGAVHGPGHADPLFLTSAQVDTLLSNLCLVSGRQDVDIRLQTASLDHLAIPAGNKVLYLSPVLIGVMA